MHKRLAASAPAGALASSSTVVGEGRPSPTDLLWDAKQAYHAGAPLPSLFTNLYASRALNYAPPMVIVTPAGEKDKERVREGRWTDEGWDAGWQATAGAAWEGVGQSSRACLRAMDDCLLILSV